MKKNLSDWVDVAFGVSTVCFMLCLFTISITTVFAAKNCPTECSTLSCTTANPGDCGQKNCSSDSECSHCSCQKVANGCDCNSKSK
jgi:hypothetical protein